MRLIDARFEGGDASRPNREAEANRRIHVALMDGPDWIGW